MKRASAQRRTAKKFCIESGCKSAVSSHGYCRLHYIANWRLMRLDAKIKAERRLNAYVEGMSKRFPKDFMERIKDSVESDDKFQETMESLAENEEAQVNETEREFVERLRRNYKIED